MEKMIDCALYFGCWNMNGMSNFCKLRHLCLCFMGLFTTVCEQIDNPALASPGQPEERKLLLEPLKGVFPSVGNHVERDRFTSGDENYQIISA